MRKAQAHDALAVKYSFIGNLAGKAARHLRALGEGRSDAAERAAAPEPIPYRSRSYRSEIQTADEDNWHGTVLRFASFEEAEEHLRDLEHRWGAVLATRVIVTDDPVRHRYVDGEIEAVDVDAEESGSDMDRSLKSPEKCWISAEQAHHLVNDPNSAGTKSQWLEMADKLGRLARSEKDEEHRLDLLHDARLSREIARLLARSSDDHTTPTSTAPSRNDG